MSIAPATILAFQEKILSFYQQKGRDLPWRQTTDAYAILISEIMLQQTQVDRVKSYYENWLAKWPTFADLASADRADVLTAWLGLGYNNRGVNLHKAAQMVAQECNGDILTALRADKKLPGIGPYTSRSVRIFAANDDIATVDTNIRRILIHEFHLSETLTDKELFAIAQQCLPAGKSRDWHNALMDYGATFLTSRRTGIKPKTQQSKFQGSDRQIRAKLLRYFLVKKTANIDELQQHANEPSRERMINILDGMVVDELIHQNDHDYSFRN